MANPEIVVLITGEVYKGFFDGDETIRRGLGDISALSLEAYQAIKDNNFLGLIDLISKEGSLRENLFPSILSPKMKEFKSDLAKSFPQCGMKVCGPEVVAVSLLLMLRYQS